MAKFFIDDILLNIFQGSTVRICSKGGRAIVGCYLKISANFFSGLVYSLYHLTG